MKNSNFFFVNNIKINNIDKNKNIIDYLENLKIKIPHFCYHQNLSIAGNCRMCLIELKNSPKPLISCSMVITNKMELYTDSPLVKKARENVLEFLLLNHPLDCPVCDQGGECDLQDQSMNFGTSKKRFYNYKTSVGDKNLGPIVKTVMTRCIHCTRCVRFANEIAGVEDLGVFGRGSNMEIGTYINKTFQSELSGNIIDICPVGALTSKPYSFIDRNWELKNLKTIDFSDSNCLNLNIFVKNTQTITKITPDYNEHYNLPINSWISDKTRFSFDGMFSPERISEIFLATSKNKIENISNWSSVFKEIVNILYFYNHLNKHLSKKFILTIIANNNLNLETWTILFLLKKKFSFIEIKKADNHFFNKNFCNEFNCDFTPNKIDKINLSILIGLNSRYESPFINLSLKKRYLKGNFKLFGINSFLDLTFPIKTLGLNLKILKKITEGTHYLCQNIKFSKTLILCNSELLKREDNNSIYNILSLIKNFNKNLTVNVINSNINESGSYFFNNTKIISQKDLKESSGFFFLDNNISNSILLKKLIELKLLNFIDNENFENIDEGKFLIEQNKFLKYSLKNNFKKIYTVNSYVFLPSTIFYENSGTYLNTETLYKKVVKIIPPLGLVKSNWKILRNFISYTNQLQYFNENISNISFNVKSLSSLTKFMSFFLFPLNNFSNPFFYNSTLKKNQIKFIENYKIRSKKFFNTKPILWIEDFFIGGKDDYSILSKVMIECSKNLRLANTNFKFLI